MSLLQARNHSFPGLSVREVLRLSHVSSVPESIAHLLEKHMSDLSGGEKQKVAMTCAINSGCLAIGLLDEPFSALDQEAVDLMWTTLCNCLPNVGLLVAVPRLVMLE